MWDSAESKRLIVFDVDNISSLLISCDANIQNNLMKKFTQNFD